MKKVIRDVDKHLKDKGVTIRGKGGEDIIITIHKTGEEYVYPKIGRQEAKEQVTLSKEFIAMLP